MAGRHRPARAAHRARPRRAPVTMLLIAAAALIAVVLGGTGSGGTFAAWNSSVAIRTVSLDTGSAALTTGGFQNLTTTYSSSATTSVGLVTVANSGRSALASFGTQASVSSGTSALAGATSVSIWPTTASSCPAAVPSGTTAATGTWSSAPAWLGAQGALAAGATTSYCVLTSVPASVQAQYPSTSATVTVEVEGATGANLGGWNTGWVSAGPFTLTTPAPASTSIPGTDAGLSGTSKSGAATVTVSTTLDGNQMANAYYPCLAIDITTTSKTPTTWTLTVGDAHQPFDSIPFANWAWTGGSGATLSSGSRTVGGGTLVLTGSSSFGNLDVSSSAPVTLTFCLTESGYTAPVETAGSGYFSESAQTVASCTSPTQPATQYSACIYTTLTGTDPYFYVGYSFTINVATVAKGTAYAQYTISQAVPAPGGNAALTSSTSKGVTTYTVTSTGLSNQDGAIGDGQQIVVCAYLQS